MKIEILGSGCAKCKQLEHVVKEAVSQQAQFIQIEKIDQIAKIMEYGVMSTPALVIDGEVVSVGKVLSVDDVLALMKD